MTNFPEGVQKALDRQKDKPEQYLDVHVGFAPRDYMKVPARDIEDRIPQAHLLHGDVMVFGERGGFQTWGEDFENGEHEPGHILVRIHTSLYNSWAASERFYQIESYVEATLSAFAFGWEDDFRLVDYMVVDRDITTWGKHLPHYLTRFH